MASSRQVLTNFLENSLNEDENVRQDVLQSSMLDEFFSDAELPDAQTDKVHLATFDVGMYKPEEVHWKVEKGHITIRGQKCRTTNRMEITGSKFCRDVEIPSHVNPDTVTARFCVGGGLLVVEGNRQDTKPERKRMKTAFFGNSHFSLSVDLGDDVPPLTYTLVGVEDKPKDSDNMDCHPKLLSTSLGG